MFGYVCSSKEGWIFLLFFFSKLVLSFWKNFSEIRIGRAHHKNYSAETSSLYTRFNKSGRHLEFSMNDVIRGKIIHVAKMATKDESSVDVDFAVCSYKKDCFYFISRGLFSLYNAFMGMLS